jgi:ABC-type phosphate/phosphonate transport system substrate-binding protein
VRKDHPARTIADLRGKSFVYMNRNSITGYLFPEMLLCEAGLPELPRFFGKQKQVRKEKSALYAVLLGEADVACISESLLEVLSELNPAIGRKLRVLAKSEPFPKGLLVGGPNLPPDAIPHLLAALCDDTPNASRRDEALTFFHVDGFVRAADSDLDSVRRLVKQIDSRRKRHMDPGCSRWISDVEVKCTALVGEFPVRFCSKKCRDLYLSNRERARPDAKDRVYVIGVSPYMMFDRDPRDTRASLDLLLEEFHRKNDYGLIVEMLPSNEVAQVRFGEGTMSWAYLSGPGYVRMRKKVGITPVVRYSMRRDSFRASLVTLQKSGFTDLPDLEGQVLAMSTDESSTARLYLETVMHGTGRPAEEYFSSIVSCPSEESAVRAVALGEATAALVSTQALGLLKELSPGLYGGLSAIRTSEELISGPICQADGLPKKISDSLTKYVLKLHEKPAGKELLMAFRTTRLVRATDADYEPIRRMMKTLEEKR